MIKLINVTCVTETTPKGESVHQNDKCNHTSNALLRHLKRETAFNNKTVHTDEP
uniref:Uncharacterized protein n=1 Tax=Parascaris equorum TaxID=6256 RepID=A0A914RQS1_PAREQ